MKVVFLDTTMGGSVFGGAHTFLDTITSALVKERFEVHLVTEGIPIAITAQNIMSSGAVIHTGIWKKGMLVEDSVPVLSRWINGLKPDVYVLSASADIGWAVLPLLNPEIATLTIGHNDSENFFVPAKHYSSFLNLAIGVSPQICETYRSYCGIDEKRVTWIPYGVEINEEEPFKPSNSRLRLIYVGRLDERQKRVSDLVKVVKSLSRSEVRYCLQIVGDGEERLRMEENFADEIANGRVVFRGWLESDEVINAMRQSEVFVLTSAYEGFCIALTESMANGCCPVVTNIRSGNKNLINDDESGFLVEIGDIEGFAEKLKYLDQNREKLLKMRKLAWQRGKEFGVDKMIENYKSCFRSAVDDALVSPREVSVDFPLMETCSSPYPLWIRRLKRRFIAQR